MLATTQAEETTTLQKLSRDLKAAAITLTDREARYLVDLYYQLQSSRIRAEGQIRAINQDVDDGAMHETLDFFFGQFETLERQMQNALGAYAAGKMPGRWARSLMGIGPVISAGLLAHIDIRKAPHAGNLMRFAGLTNDVWLGADRAKALVKECEAMADDPDDPEELLRLAASKLRRPPENLRKMALSSDDEEGGTILTKAKLTKTLALRPWNADLKCLTVFKLGESFVKVQNNDRDYYGHVFASRKALYATMNEEGRFKADAEHVLSQKNIGKNTDAYKAYIEGKLPKAHIHARARRYAVKLFLSHLHEVMYFGHYAKLPALPWIIDIGGHRDFEPPPNMDQVPGMREAYLRSEERRIYLK